MYDLIKNVLTAGGYKLADVVTKIKRFYLMGDLTEAQMEELLSMAAAGVSADAERPETLAMFRSLADQIQALSERVDKLEGGTEVSPEHPAWKPWDGISKDYQPGAIVSHKGQLWVSDYPGQNVWEPGTVGTEGLWRKYEG